MSKLVVLQLEGEFERGFWVKLEIGEEKERPSAETQAFLPPNLKLPAYYESWQLAYRRLGSYWRIKPKAGQVTNISITELSENFHQEAQQFYQLFHQWLNSDPFRPIREKLLEKLIPSDEIRLIIQTENNQLRRLPWHLWDFFKRYPKAELALSAPEYERPAKAKIATYREKVKILAILGNSTGIDVTQDRVRLEQLPDAETTFMVEPQRKELNEQLWNQAWDILFFAGHSASHPSGETGRIYINQTDSLTPNELEYGLKTAINQGLKLAIFNSCDGLGLAHQLENLHISQMIVMREPVPDLVAQEFFHYFLTAYSGGKPLYLAVREAREKLQGIEDKFPCATWLPVICQNPAEMPPMWQDLGRRPKPDLIPYRGLFAFKEADSPFFFGREAFVELLVEAVLKQPLLAVIGPSGSGKSSVVFAGLIPHLQKQGNWRIVSFRPSNRPLHALATALIPQLEPQMSKTDRLREIRKLAADFRQEISSLRDVVDNLGLENPGDRLLLVADQFEELYALCRDGEERQIFLDRVLETVKHAENFCFVMTLRADFFGQALSYRPFADALQYADLKLGPMTDEELQAAIEMPAALLDVTLESGLTERILNAVSAEPGDLPLLEFALTQLWAKQQNCQLTHAAYDEIGGVEAALARYADEAHDQLNEEEKERARRIFSQLVRPGEGTEDTRRLATRMEVGEENWDLVTRLANLRLVVTNSDENTGEETVELVHEALIRGWENLRLWIELDRAFRTWQERLRAALRQWEASKRDDGALLRGAPLAEAQAWLVSRRLEVSATERSFIEQSAKARIQKRQRLIFGLSFGLVGALMLAGVAGLQWQRAEKQRQETLVAQLVTQARLAKEQFASQPTEALALAINTASELKKLTPKGSKYPTSEPILALQMILDNIQQQRINAVVEFNPQGDRILHVNYNFERNIAIVRDLQRNQLVRLQGHQGRIEAAQISPDGKYIVTGGKDCTARMWDFQGNQLAVFKGHGSLIDVRISPDSQRIVTLENTREPCSEPNASESSGEFTARLWNLQGKQLAVLGEQWHPLQFSPDSKHLQFYVHKPMPFGQTVQLWDLQGKLWSTFKEHQGAGLPAHFSPDGKYLAEAVRDGAVNLWNLQNKKRLTFKAHPEYLTAVQFSPTSKYFATTGGSDGIVSLWNLQGKQLLTFKAHHKRVSTVQFSPNGNYIATSGEDGTVSLRNLQNKKMLTFKAHRERMFDLQFSPDGSRIATAGVERRYGQAFIRLWNLQGQQLAVFEISGGGLIRFSPDGKRISVETTFNGFAGTKYTTNILHLQNKLATFSGHQGTIGAVHFSPRGDRIATQEYNGTVRLWDLQGNMTSLKGQERIAEKITIKKRVMFTPKGDRVLTAEPDQTVRVWDLKGNQVAVLPGKWDWGGSGSPVSPISPDGKYAMTLGTDNKTVRVWDLQGNQIGELSKNPGDFSRIQFSPKGDYIAVPAEKGMVRFFNFQGKQLGEFKAHPDRVDRIYFTRDGDRAIAVTFGSMGVSQSNQPFFNITSEVEGIYKRVPGKVQIWDLKGNRLATLKQEWFNSKTGTYSVDLSDSVFRSSSSSFITSGMERSLLWDSQGKLLATLEGLGNRHFFYRDSVEQPYYEPIQISADGQRIAGLTQNGKVKIWDSKGQQIAEYEGYAMALSPDGSKIVVVSKDNIPRLWRVDDLDSLLKKGCEWLSPDSLLNPETCDTSPLWRQWNQIRSDEFKKVMKDNPQYFVREPENYTKFAHVILAPRLWKKGKKQEMEPEKH